MSKSEYRVMELYSFEINKLLVDYHYLGISGAKWKKGKTYCLMRGDRVLGACIFTGFPVPELAVGMFGLARTDQEGMYELSRLVLSPAVQKEEHNIASWFVSRAIKQLRKSVNVRCILSYADSDYHSGIIYRALGFMYCGLSEPRKDYYVDGKKLSKVYDKKLSLRWPIQ